jgi:MinD superfamily P-loop ATPase
MHTLLILSGKGGTGKTTVASTFIALSDVRAYADCDVDAPNLHLVMGAYDTVQHNDYHDLDKAVIDPDLCTACDLCYQVCRFGAVLKGQGYEIDPIACEGCTYCAHICPTDAITMQRSKAGELFLYSREAEHFSTAELSMGSGTTGKLVTKVKNQLKEIVDKTQIAILDGSPGIGCPVIASLTGATLALMVAEPSVSGLSDLKRVVHSARHLRVPVAVIVNKADMNRQRTTEIKEYCVDETLPFLGTIPYDRSVVEAVNNATTLAGLNTPAATAIAEIYGRTIALLKERIES